MMTDEAKTLDTTRVQVSMPRWFAVYLETSVLPEEIEYHRQENNLAEAEDLIRLQEELAAASEQGVPVNDFFEGVVAAGDNIVRFRFDMSPLTGRNFSEEDRANLCKKLTGHAQEAAKRGITCGWESASVWYAVNPGQVESFSLTGDWTLKAE